MILNVDERKMEHDDPKATTTKGHDTRTVHALEPPERKTNRHRSKPQPPRLHWHHHSIEV
jgi:hypothetical protein